MLDMLFGGKRRASGWGGGFWGGFWSSGRVRTQAGVEVDEELALTHSTYWNCVRLISESTAGLPIRFVERDETGNTTEFPTDPNAHLLTLQPNPTMMALPFREGRTMHMASWGQGFSEIEFGRPTKTNPRGEVVNLWPIHPSRVRPVRVGDVDEKGRNLTDAGFDYMVRGSEGEFLAMRADEILHLPGVLSEDGIWGKSITANARQEIGMGIAQQRYSATSFGAGGQPRGIVYGQGLKNKEARQNFREEWREVHGSPDSGEIAILPLEAKFQSVDRNPVEMALIEGRRYTGLEICRFFRVPAHLAGYTEGATSSSLEQLGMEFVIYGLLRWCTAWEQQCSLKLVPEAMRGRRKMEHVLHGLMRGDLTARMTAYRTGIGTGVLSINDCLRMEGLNTLGVEGDEHYVPLNMQTVRQAKEGNVGRSGQPAPGRGGPGSDQSGAPAEGGDGDGTGDKPEAAFHELTRRLGKARGGDLRQTLRRLERRVRQLERPAPAVPVRADARPVLVDALGRMFRKEANAAARAAKGADFPAWLETWRGRHAATLAEALGPAAALAGFDAEDVAGRVVTASCAALAQRYDTETPGRFAELLAAWPARADAAADAILNPTENRHAA